MAAHAVVAARRSPMSDAEDAKGSELLVSVPGVPDSSVLTGDVRVEGSTDVVIENMTVFQGPVTVKQVNAGNGVPPKDARGEGGEYGEEGEQTCGMGPCAFRWALGILALVLGVIVIVVTLATLLSTSGEDAVLDGDSSAAGGGAVTENGAYDGDKLVLVSRMEWGGRPPTSPADPMAHPVPFVIVSHTATEHCSTLEVCASVVRSVQAFHMDSRGWWDVGYNFMVGGDGRAYEGRGWDGVGAHARSYNNVSVGLSFIGTFSDVEPPPRQVKAALRLIEEGVRLGKLSADYGLLAHRQVSPTESPGEKLFEMMKTWPHWTEPEG